MSKKFLFFVIFSVFIQILFSFYYSSNIVTQNNQLYEYQTKLDQLKIDISNFELQLANLTSIKHFYNNSTNSAQLQFITKTIKLNN